MVKFQRENAAKNHGDQWLAVELATALYAQALAEDHGQAALLHEAGAEVEALVREPRVRWLNTRHLVELLMDSKISPFKAPGKIGPIVLIGHSQGANNVIDAARSLETHKIPVDLLVTLAPLLQYPIPANVVRAINYYQSPGWGAPITGEGNFHGKIVNINMKDDPTVLHINIDKSPKVHAEIVREILAVSAKQQEANIKASDVKQ